MALRLKISTVNYALDKMLDDKFPAGSIMEIYSGTIPTNADTAISGQTLLGAITLPSTPWAAASARSKAKNGTYQDTSADGGSATAPTFVRVKNAADTERMDLTAGVGSGDVSFDGSITAGQPITMNTFAIAA